LKIPNITAALALSLAVAIPAVAQSNAAEEAKRSEAVDKWFTQYDRNRDGHVTVDEYSMGKSYFAALDANKDGILTRDEAKAALTPRKRAMDWKKLDTDKDGYVTVREWTGTPEEFDEHDLDGDRVLSSYDRELGREMNRAENRLEAFDKDKDGFVSRKEWPADAATFEQRDRNHDEKLTVEELMEDVKKKG